jgi:hypothetical protein
MDTWSIGWQEWEGAAASEEAVIGFSKRPERPERSRIRAVHTAPLPVICFTYVSTPLLSHPHGIQQHRTGAQPLLLKNLGRLHRIAEILQE